MVRIIIKKEIKAIFGPLHQILAKFIWSASVLQTSLPKNYSGLSSAKKEKTRGSRKLPLLSNRFTKVVLNLNYLSLGGYG